MIGEQITNLDIQFAWLSSALLGYIRRICPDDAVFTVELRGPKIEEGQPSEIAITWRTPAEVAAERQEANP